MMRVKPNVSFKRLEFIRLVDSEVVAPFDLKSSVKVSPKQAAEQ